MNATLNYINFQRNGVQGTPFYHCKVDILDDIKRKMFVTFEATEDDKQINVSSCRALFVEDLSMKFRGDEIGYAITDCAHRSSG